MALKRVGSRLVAEGASQYTNTLGKAADATRKVGQASRDASGGVDTLNTRSLVLATTLGNVLARAIEKVFSGMVNLGKEALNEYARYERLTFAVESLVARELKAADSTLAMSDALGQAAPIAQDLLRWIQNLAIESPFDTFSVAQAFKTAQAYGFTAKEAQSLTQIMIDFASATGGASEVMNRIALALGQIKAKGKLAGQEILQLVNAGVNVSAILKSMGYNLEDVRTGLVSADEFLKAFAQTMDEDFGGAAKRSMNTISGLLNSMSDLKSISLREFFTPFFQEVQPYLSAFVEKWREAIPILSYIGELVGKVTAYLIENREAILKVVAALTAGVAAFFLIINAGTIFSAVAGIVTAALSAIASAITFLLSPIGLLSVALAGLAALFIFSFNDIKLKAGNFFDDFGNNMWKFGHDLVLAFAEGMAVAVNYVLDVLIQIGNLITEWLSPGSPPKLLPQLDQWGTEAMNEYFRGFLNADFNIFNRLSQTISRFIRSLDIPEKDVIPRILGARNAIAAAIAQVRETGKVGKEAIQNIMNAIGATNPAIESYIQAMIRAEAASEAVKRAQERLNEVSRKYQEILNPLNAELDAIARRRQEVIDQQRKAELQAILSDKNAPALAKELAQMELREIELKNQVRAVEDKKKADETAAQTALDKAKLEEEAAQQQLELQQDLIQAQTENNELIKQQIALLERLNKESAKGGTAKARAGAAGKPSLTAGDLGLPEIGGGAGIESPFGGLIDEWRTKIGTLVDEISGKFDGIGEKLNTLSQTWGKAFSVILALPMWGEIKQKFDDWGFSMDDIIQGALLVLAAFITWRAIVGFLGPIITVISAIAGVIGGPLTIAGLAAGASWGLALAKYGSTENVLAQAGISFIKLGGIIDIFIADKIGKLIRTFARVGAIIITVFVTGLLVLGRTFAQVGAIILYLFLSTLKKLILALIQWVLDAIAQITEWKTQLIQKVTEAWDSVKEKFTEKKDELLALVEGFITGILCLFTDADWFSGGAAIIEGLLGGINDNAQKIYDAIWDVAQSVWDAITNFFDFGSPSKLMIDLGRRLDESFALGLEKYTNLVEDAARKVALTTSRSVSSIPITSPALATSQNTTYNQNRVSVADQINVSDRLDAAMLINQLQQVLNDSFPSSL